MKNQKTALTVIALLMALALTFSAGCGAAPSAAEEAAPPAEPAAADEPAPAIDRGAAADAQETGSLSTELRFTTTDREGNPWDESVFADHALTMINFWEPWCGPCVGEMPDLQALYEAYADQGLMILGVYATPGMEEDVDAVLAQTGVQYPILNFCEGFEAFESGYVPTTIFVDQEGHVIHRELTSEERGALGDVIQMLGEEQTSALYIGSNSYANWAAIIEDLL